MLKALRRPIKAILGGRCVDTGEDLGPPLTGNVRTFLGIAGGNHGALFCLKDNYPECNAINGLGCGSMFLVDINSRQVWALRQTVGCWRFVFFVFDISDQAGFRSHYEGQAVFSLLSTSDQVVGYEVCGQQTAVVPASDRIVTVSLLPTYILIRSRFSFRDLITTAFCSLLGMCSTIY